MTQFSVEQATQRLADLVDAAVQGEDVVVVHQGHGAVRLVPVENQTGRPQFGSAKGQITMSDDFDAPLDDFREYMEPAVVGKDSLFDAYGIKRIW